ncbi:unnamed protein product, partial [Musa acuminata subsp. burmannicoides]
MRFIFRFFGFSSFFVPFLDLLSTPPTLVLFLPLSRANRFVLCRKFQFQKVAKDRCEVFSGSILVCVCFQVTKDRCEVFFVSILVCVCFQVAKDRCGVFFIDRFA